MTMDEVHFPNFEIATWDDEARQRRRRALRHPRVRQSAALRLCKQRRRRVRVPLLARELAQAFCGEDDIQQAGLCRR